MPNFEEKTAKKLLEKLNYGFPGLFTLDDVLYRFQRIPNKETEGEYSNFESYAMHTRYGLFGIEKWIGSDDYHVLQPNLR